MEHRIKTLYIVHHSHTDIGYTDLQERIVDVQVEHIRAAIRDLNRPENQAFRWNCETYFCVERFLEVANAEERRQFFALARQGRIGVSATYLNFNDLVDADVLKRRTAEMVSVFGGEDIPVRTAMIADINGISMGQRDALLANGVEFLFTNIHTHHGMYPLWRNQNAYWWENAAGQRLLIWNGEHYNLGNALGIKPNRINYYMERNYFGDQHLMDGVENLHKNLEHYLAECEEAGYPYDFIVSGVSGVFSDNAPPNPEILRTIEAYHHRYGDAVRLQMVSLQELYAAIADRLGDLPVYRGDLTDWWANGVGSAPDAVKHYRAAQRMFRLANALDDGLRADFPAVTRVVEDNLLLYAEHTFGHSATVSNPYETQVRDLELRKSSYASKAHEGAAKLLNRALLRRGGTLLYYNTDGTIRATNAGPAGNHPVEFYVETMTLPAVRVANTGTGEEMTVQLSAHPRGVRVTFVDTFAAGESKEYRYEELPAPLTTLNSRHAFVGAERVRDIVNDFDPETYRLPYEVENPWFRIAYRVGEGFTAFVNKTTGQDMLGSGLARFFTPVYERTALRHPAYEERALLGRNIRGVHAQQFAGEMTGVRCVDQGPVFTTLEFTFRLEGTRQCFVLLRVYRALPRLDFALRLAKNLSDDIESVYLPLELSLPLRQAWLRKGAEAFRPGVDQIPGTGMEYWATDEGVAYLNAGQAVQVFTPDTPLVYMGELQHHPIALCDGKEENNRRPVWSWVMNNTWETNFPLDLSGFYEFNYRLDLSDATDAEACLDEMEAKSLGLFTHMM